MSSDREEETRKVQLAGNSTFTVSLPKAWAVDRDIEPGTEVTVWPLEQGVLVSSVAARDAEWRLDCDGLAPEAVATAVEELYVAGADAVVLRASDGLDEATRRAVADATTELVGLSVDHGTGTSLRLSCALDVGKFPLERTLLQLQHVGLSMVSDAARAVAAADPGLAAQVAERFPEVDRQARVVARCLHRSLTDFREVAALDVSRPVLFDYAFAAWKLRQVARMAREVAALERDPALDWPDEFETRARAASKLVEDGVDVLLAADDVRAAVAVVQESRQFREDVAGLHDALYAGDLPGGPAAGRAFATVERTADVAGSVGRRAIRASVRD